MPREGGFHGPESTIGHRVGVLCLRWEIQTGPTGPRARMGTLQSDLRKLKAYLN